FGFAAIPPTIEESNSKPIPFNGVLFTGSPWPYRQMVLQRIAAKGLPLRIYGHSWDRKGGWPSTPGKWSKFAHDLRWYLLPRLREEGPQLAAQFLRRIVPDRNPAVQSDRFPAGTIQGNYQKDEFVPLVRGAAINLGFTQMLLDVTKE